MRRAARIDDNHAAIVAALRACGASVQSLAAVGNGCPDLLVGFRGENHLLEVKDGKKSLSRRRMTEMQNGWHARWSGSARMVDSIDAALDAIGVIIKKY